MFISLIILEAILIITMVVVEFTNFKYKTWPNWLKIASRVLLILPLLLISIFHGFTLFSTLIFVMLIIAMTSDILIIYNFIFGLIGFAVCHSLNTINFWIAQSYFSINYLLLLVLLLLVGLLIFKFIFEEKVQFPMDFALIGYIIIITLSFWRTFSISPILIFGVLLFYLCDLEVAYTSFIKEFPFYQQLNHLLYYGALICLAISPIFVCI